MKYKFYGTAAAEGLPGIFCECENCNRARKLGGRNIMTRSQSAIDGVLGIDFSADTYMHVLNYGFPASDISTYIITHNHADHFYPQDFLNHAKGYSYFGEKVIDIYVAKSGYDLADEVLKDKSYVHLHLVEPFKPFTTKEGYNITPLKANHKQDPVIYLIEKDGKCVLHSNDTGYYLEETWQYFEEHKPHIDFAEFDCTMGMQNADNTQHPNHMNFPTVQNVRSRLESIGCIDENSICVINHFTHNTGMVYEDFKKLGDENGFLTSYDGFEVEF